MIFRALMISVLTIYSYSAYCSEQKDDRLSFKKFGPTQNFTIKTDKLDIKEFVGHLRIDLLISQYSGRVLTMAVSGEYSLNDFSKKVSEKISYIGSLGIENDHYKKLERALFDSKDGDCTGKIELTILNNQIYLTRDELLIKFDKTICLSESEFRGSIFFDLFESFQLEKQAQLSHSFKKIISDYDEVRFAESGKMKKPVWLTVRNIYEAYTRIFVNDYETCKFIHKQRKMSAELNKKTFYLDYSSEVPLSDFCMENDLVITSGESSYTVRGLIDEDGKIISLFFQNIIGRK